MALIDSIAKAKASGVSPDDILSEIQKQNPQKASVIQQARSMGASGDQILNEIVNQNQPKTLSGFGMNLLSSAGNLVGGIGQAISHPINTLTALGKVGAGALDYAADVVGGPMPNDQKPDYIQQNRQAFDSLTSNYKQRYGGASNIVNTLYKDPLGAAADASVVLGGVGGAIGKIGEAGDFSRIAEAGQAMSKVGETLNPLNAAGNAIKGTLNVGSNLLSKGSKVQSFLTNTPTAAFEAATNPETAPLIKQAMDAGDNPALKVGLGQQIFKTAQGIKQAAQADYQTQRAAIVSQYADQILAKQPEIQQGISDFFKSENGGGVKIIKGKVNLAGSALEGDASAQKTLQGIYNLINTAPESGEILNKRQAISNLIESIPREQTNLKRIATGALKTFDRAVDQATVDENGISQTAQLRSSYAQNVGPASKIIKSLVKYDNGVPQFSQDKAVTFANSLILDGKFDNSQLVQQIDSIAGKNFTQQAKAIGFAKALSRLDPPTAGRVMDIVKGYGVARIPGASAIVSPYFWGKIALNKGMEAAKASEVGQVASQGMLKTVGDLLIKAAPKAVAPSRIVAPVMGGAQSPAF